MCLPSRLIWRFLRHFFKTASSEKKHAQKKFCQIITKKYQILTWEILCFFDQNSMNHIWFLPKKQRTSPMNKLIRKTQKLVLIGTYCFKKHFSLPKMNRNNSLSSYHKKNVTQLSNLMKVGVDRCCHLGQDPFAFGVVLQGLDFEFAFAQPIFVPWKNKQKISKK